jgi:glycosyltransferase involved in cell wall biosynthesis
VRCPTFEELPSPPAGKTGWPWTAADPPLRDAKTDGSPWPRVSVVTPSLNQGRFLEETIRSVLLQGYPDLEYILIDGGSTDETLAIIHKYEQWLAYWVSEPDRGQAHAINKGWARSTGDILAYINADDVYLPGAITRAAAAFSVEPGAGMVYGTAIIVNEAGEELNAWTASPFDLRKMLTVGSTVPQSSVFFSSDALKDVGYLNDEWQLIMDYDLCTRIGLQYPTVCITETLSKFRNHPLSKTRLRFELMADELVQFVRALKPNDMSARAWKKLQRATISRVHYELALAYLRDGERAEPQAFTELLRSAFLYPWFVLKQPLLTAHIVRRAAAEGLRATARRSRRS